MSKLQEPFRYDYVGSFLRTEELKKATTQYNENKITKEVYDNIVNEEIAKLVAKQILSFYDVLKSMIASSLSDGSFLTIEKTYLEYYSLPVRLSNNGSFTSAIGYYPGSLEAITKLMKENLELEKHEMTKTFSFDANEEYTTKITGQGITTGAKLETMPNFVGKSVNEVETWATNHNIILHKEFVDETSSYYNPNIAPGLVSNQSISNGILLSSINEITIYINSISSTQNNPTKPNEENNNFDTPDDNDEQIDKDDPLDDILPGNDDKVDTNDKDETSESETNKKTV